MQVDAFLLIFSPKASGTIQTRKLSILQSKQDDKKPKPLFLHISNRLISELYEKKWPETSFVQFLQRRHMQSETCMNKALKKKVTSLTFSL
jgi:hypothetical protein